MTNLFTGKVLRWGYVKHLSIWNWFAIEDDKRLKENQITLLQGVQKVFWAL